MTSRTRATKMTSSGLRLFLRRRCLLVLFTLLFGVVTPQVGAAVDGRDVEHGDALQRRAVLQV